MHDPNVLEKVIQKLDDKFIGFDSQTEKLTNILDSFAKTNEGGSALLFGPPSCGKSSIIRKVVLRYARDMEVVFIDGILHTNDAAAVRIVNELEFKLKRPYIIVVLNVDQFVLRANQILLYKVLDATRSQPLFTLCVTCRQDCTQLLEKRVRSRLSNITISFVQPELSLTDFKEAFASFLKVESKKNRYTKHNQAVKEFVEQFDVYGVLRSVYRECRSFGVLKQLTATFICFLLAEDMQHISTTDECCSVLLNAKNTILPTQDAKQPIISSLTLRQLCLLTCCVRLVRNHRRREFTYRNVVQGYRRLTNSYLASLSVQDDVILYKELDTLADFALLEKPSTSAGQLAFRTTSLQVDEELVVQCLKAFSPLPVAISQWLDDLDK